MIEETKNFNDLKSLGAFLKENRILQGIKIEEASQALLIKKEILKKFEEGNANFSNSSYLKGFLKSYIKFLKLEKKCKFELPNKKIISSLDKPNFKLETSEAKKRKYGSIIIFLSLIVIGLIYLFWNKNTYLNLYLIGSSLN